MAENGEKKATSYVVLEQKTTASVEETAERAANYYWVECARITARSAQDAISHWAKEGDVTGGIFIAVPSRSWKSVKVAVETQTKLKFS